MKTLLLANPFKGSLPSETIIKISRACGFKTIPVSDGGDGLLDAFSFFSPASKIKKIRVKNAYGKEHLAEYLSLDRKTCAIETARAVPLGAGNVGKKLPVLKTSSYGLGQMLAAAYKAGAETFYIGLGGAACNDGGAGMAQALGCKFFGSDGKEMNVNTGNLVEIKKIDLSALKKYKKIKFYALTDVKNPLLGPKGSARIFGPQKGADKKEVKVIENGLKNLSSFFPSEIKNRKGSAAAGAIAYGLCAFLGAEIVPGAEFIFDKLGIEKEIKNADRIILTEGKLDAQTFMGKAPGLAARMAKKHKKEICFICGLCELTPAEQKKYSLNEVRSFVAQKCTKEEIAASVKNAAKLFKRKLP